MVEQVNEENFFQTSCHGKHMQFPCVKGEKKMKEARTKLIKS